MAVSLAMVRDELEKATSDCNVVLFLDRKIVPIQEIVRVRGVPYVFLCDKSRSMMKAKVTESERGMIGFCLASGVSETKIAAMLDRPVELITRQRKKFGMGG
jgi:hypothetical protein